MRPAAAFAVGLWTGAVVAAGLGAFYFKPWQHAGTESTPKQAAESKTKDDELLRLRQDNARLSAEAQRLRQTVTELKTFRSAPPAAVPPAVPAAEPAPAARSPEPPAAGDPAALQRLQEAAARNDEPALQQLAAQAEGGGSYALMSVWNATSLNLSNKLQATYYIGATLEGDRLTDEWLRSLFGTPNMDSRFLFAALDGLASVTGGVQPNLERRMQLLDSLKPLVKDEQLRARLDEVREKLAALAAQPPAR
jgi:hypothetical protein